MQENSVVLNLSKATVKCNNHDKNLFKYMLK